MSITGRKKNEYSDSGDNIGLTGVSESDILTVLKTESKSRDYLDRIKSISDLNDKVLSDWLNISEKTLRNYRRTDTRIKENIREHIIYLWRLMMLGQSVFGSKEAFNQWMNSNNIFFDDAKPADYMNTITGIRFVIDRVTAMEYGDNV